MSSPGYFNCNLVRSPAVVAQSLASGITIVIARASIAFVIGCSLPGALAAMTIVILMDLRIGSNPKSHARPDSFYAYILPFLLVESSDSR